MKPLPSFNRMSQSTGSIVRLVAVFVFLFAVLGICTSLHADTIRGEIHHNIGVVTNDMKLLPAHKGVIAGKVSAPTSNQFFVPQGITKTAGFILPDLIGQGRIIKNITDYIQIGTNDIVFIDLGESSGSRVGARYLVFNEDRIIQHPVYSHGSEHVLKPEKQNPWGIQRTRNMSFGWDRPDTKKKSIGHLVKILGELEILEVGPTRSKAIVRHAYEDIRLNDMVIPYEPKKVTISKRSNTKNTHGYIIASRDPNKALGNLDIVYLDRGTQQNVERGDMLEIYSLPREGVVDFELDVGIDPYFAPKRKSGKYLAEREPPKPLLPHVIGELIVVDTQAETSTAVITQSDQSIQVGDPVRAKH